MKNYQAILFPYAYNILGSAEDAKDTVQDVIAKHLGVRKKHIENEKGYLIKSVINQSINTKSRKLKFATGQVWLPEPLSTENAEGKMEREEVLSYSLLVVLEKLTAKERAIFILKEAFDYAHKEIAETIGVSIENSRKLLSRAKIKLTNYRPENTSDFSQNTQGLQKYMQAILDADIEALEKLLSEDILLAADGGEDIKVVRELTTGITNASKLILYVHKAFLAGLKFRVCSVNHQPAILFYKNKTLYNCQVFELSNKKIKSIYSIVDPKKLKSIFH